MFTNIIKRIKKTPVALWLLLLVCMTIILMMQVHVSGPKITQLIFQPKENTVVASFNSLIDSSKELRITIEPSLNFDVTLNANSAYIFPHEPLLQNTKYIITFHDVHDMRGKIATSQKSFTTDKARYAYLYRDGTNDDQIRMKYIGEQKEKVIAQLPRIARYAINEFQEALVITDEQTPRLSSKLYLASNASTEELVLPDNQIAIDAISNTFGSLFAVILQDTKTYENKMYLFNPDQKAFSELHDVGNNSIYASSTVFGPDGTTILYQDARNSTMNILDSVSQRPATNFGVVHKIEQIFNNGSSILYQSTPGVFMTRNSDGKVSSLLEDITQSDMNIIKNDNVSIALKIYYETTSSKISVIKTENGSTTEILTVNAKDENIRYLKLSHNAELISVDSVVNPAQYDKYRLNPKPINNRIKILNNGGSFLEEVTGSDIVWL